MGNTFLSTHLYYSSRLNFFLEEAVCPFLNTIQNNKLSNAFFFIRYWDRGLHIRLRLSIEEKNRDLVQEQTAAHFTAFFKKYPSSRVEPNYPSSFPANLKWLPNNSFHFVDYQAETARYGGNKGISLAEKQFFISSNTAINLIKRINKNGDAYEDLLSTVLPYHLSFAQCLGLDKKTQISFFKMIFEIWKKRSIELDFEETFKAYAPAIVPNVELLINGIEQQFRFEDKILMKWMNSNRAYSFSFDESHLEPYLSHPASIYAERETEITLKASAKHWSILADHLHLFNNRMGLHTKEEALLAYLIYRSLEHCP